MAAVSSVRVTYFVSFSLLGSLQAFCCGKTKQIFWPSLEGLSKNNSYGFHCPNVKVTASVTVSGLNVVPVINNITKTRRHLLEMLLLPVQSCPSVWTGLWRTDGVSFPLCLARKVSSKCTGKTNALLLSKNGCDQRFLFPTWFHQLVSEFKEL